jgi:hypothetical protein
MVMPGQAPGRRVDSEAGVIPVLSRNCDAPQGASQVACDASVEFSPRRKGGSGGTGRRASSLR